LVLLVVRILQSGLAFWTNFFLHQKTIFCCYNKHLIDQACLFQIVEYCNWSCTFFVSFWPLSRPHAWPITSIYVSITVIWGGGWMGIFLSQSYMYLDIHSLTNFLYSMIMSQKPMYLHVVTIIFFFKKLFSKNQFFTLGGHTLSGACLEPHALNELIPDWKEKGVKCLPYSCYSFYFNFYNSRNQCVIMFL
jgi:hypothetical protein